MWPFKEPQQRLHTHVTSLLLRLPSRGLHVWWFRSLFFIIIQFSFNSGISRAVIMVRVYTQPNYLHLRFFLRLNMCTGLWAFKHSFSCYLRTKSNHFTTLLRRHAIVLWSDGTWSRRRRRRWIGIFNFSFKQWKKRVVTFSRTRKEWCRRAKRWKIIINDEEW